MGTIAMPPILHPAAFDEMLFRDERLIPVLHQITGVIFEVLQGRHDHPILPIFEHSFNRVKGASSQSQMRTITNFLDLFYFPIFPSHEAMLQPFLRYFEQVARATPHISNVHLTIVHALGSILLRTAATRAHLGLSSSHDILVFLLGYSGRVPAQLNAALTNEERAACSGDLARVPTIYEEVYAASKQRLKRSIRVELQPEVNYRTSQIRTILPNGQPYPFPEQCDEEPRSLDNLPPMPVEFREYLPPKPLPDGQRPKPRPLGTTPRAPIPPPVTLDGATPVFRFLKPLNAVDEDQPEQKNSQDDQVKSTLPHNLPPTVERRKRKCTSEDAGEDDSDYKAQGSHSAHTKASNTSAPARTLRARGPSGTAVTRRTTVAAPPGRPAKRRKVADRYIDMLEDSEGKLHKPPGAPESSQ